MDRTDEPQTRSSHRRIAVAIDADNVSARYADAMFNEIARHGEAVLRRVYGDFSTSSMRGWMDKVSRHALVPVMSPQRARGKNSTDIELTIDVMDQLHSGSYDAFCLVSSDSDYTRLAQRLREGGVQVYVFGEAKTPESLRQSCRRFFDLAVVHREWTSQNSGSEPELAFASEGAPQPASAALPIITGAYRALAADYGDSWVPIRKMGETLANMAADFDPRSFGAIRLGDLAVATGRFDVEQRPSRGWWMREKRIVKPVVNAKPIPRRKPQSTNRGNGER